MGASGALLLAGVGQLVHKKVSKYFGGGDNKDSGTNKDSDGSVESSANSAAAPPLQEEKRATTEPVPKHERADVVMTDAAPATVATDAPVSNPLTEITGETIQKQRPEPVQRPQSEQKTIEKFKAEKAGQPVDFGTRDQMFNKGVGEQVQQQDGVPYRGPYSKPTNFDEETVYVGGYLNPKNNNMYTLWKNHTGSRGGKSKKSVHWKYNDDRRSWKRKMSVGKKAMEKKYHKSKMDLLIPGGKKMRKGDKLKDLLEVLTAYYGSKGGKPFFPIPPNHLPNTAIPTKEGC